jgi:hypothetical protein
MRDSDPGSEKMERYRCEVGPRGLDPFVAEVAGEEPTCLGEPTGRTLSDDDEALMEVLSGWGWSGGENPPKWYRKLTS